MFSRTLLLLLALQPAPADADDVSPVQVPVVAAVGEDVTIRGVDRTKAYTLEFTADGTPVLTPTRISTVGPGPVPPPSSLTERGKAIKAAAETAIGDPKREETAQGIAVIYRSLADSAEKDAKITYDALSKATSTGADSIIGRPGQPPEAKLAWKAMRAKLSEQIDTAHEDFGANLKPELIKIYREAADGLDASVVKKSIDKEFLKWLIETLLPILLKLLVP